MDADNTGGQNGNAPARPPPATTSPEWQTRLQATLEALPDLLFVMDRNGRILDFHAPNRIGLFLPPDRFLGVNAVDLLPGPAGDVVRRAIAEALATGHHQGGTYALAMPNGERWFELSIAAHGDRTADDARLVAIARDVTDRKRAEDALRESERTYRMLTEGMQDVIWVLDVETRRFTYVSPSVEKLRGYTPAEIIARPLEDAWVPEQRAELEEFTRRSVAAFLAGQMTSDDYATYEMLQPCKDGSRVASEVVARLVRNERTGRLEAHGVTRDVSKRRRAELALRESEARFAELARQTRTIVFEMDADGRCTFVSPMVEDVLGYRPEDVIGKLYFYDLFAPRDREAFKAAAFDVFRKKAPLLDFENPCLTRDGRSIWVSTNAFPLLHPDGTLRGYRGSVVDVTARKQTEQALRRSEARFAETTRQSRAFVWEVDADGLYMFVTPVVEDVLGYRPDEIAGRLHFYDLHPAAGRAEFRAAIFEAMERREKFRDYENPMVAKDGRTMWVSTNAVPLLDENGALLGYRGVDFDVTARKLAEDALRESEAQRSAINDNLPDGFIYRLDTGADGQRRRYVYVSQGVEKLHGVPAEAVLRDPTCIYSQILAEDLPLVAEKEAQAIAAMAPFSAEIRVRLPSGEIRWRLFTSAPRRLPNGHLVWDGIEIDVTERKQAEEALRESETRARAIHDNLPGGLVYQIDSGEDGRQRQFTFISQGVETLHGIAVAEAMRDAQAIYGQVAKEDLPRLVELEERAIAAMAPFQAEVRIRLPSGQTRWSLFASAPRRLPNGHLVWDGIEIDVTDRKLAEEALRESEARFAAATQASRSYVWEVDPDGLITFISPMVEEVLGRRPEEIVGQFHFYDLPPQEDREAIKRIGLDMMARRETIRGFENRNVAKDGRIVWLSSSANPLVGPDGTFRGYQGIDTDISARKQAEEALRESEARFASATQASRSFVWEVAPDGLYTHVGVMVAEVLGYRPEDLVGKMHFYDLLPPEGREELKQACFDIMARRESPSGFENANVAKDGRIVWLSSSARPLFNPDGSYRGYQGIDTDVTARKQAEEALKASETRYRELIDLAVDGILLGSPDGVITDANACMCALTGRTRRELLGKHITELFASETLDATPMRFDLVNEGETVTRVRKIVRPDASEVFVEMHSKRMPDGAYQSIFHDITRRKQAEEALRLSEAKYRQLHESMRDPFASTDLQGNLLDFNPAFVDLLGYSRAELLRLNFRDITPRKWQAQEKKIIAEQVRKRGFSAVYEKEYVRKDGSIVPVELRTMLVCDAGGKPTGMSAVIRDVSERRLAEQALRESEAKYRRLLAGMQEAFVIADMKGRLVECNPAFESLIGYSHAEVARLHYADITPAKWRSVDARAVKQVLRQGSSGVTEKEYIRKDGTVVPVEMTGTLIRDTSGKPVGISAVIHDVTERKRAEQALQAAHDKLEQRVRERTAELLASQQALAASEEQFRQMAESIQEVFWLLDVRTGQALYVSPAFEAIWGRPRQTLRDGLAQWLATLHPDDRGVVQRDYERGVRTGTFTSLEYRILWPDGTVRWIRDSAWGIRDARGRVVRVAGVFRDITDQRRLEAEILQAAEAERQRIGRDLHDGLGQSLTAIGYLADAVREDLARAQRPEADDVRKLGRLIGQTAAQSHALARGLLLADVKRGGLAAALQELAFRTQELFGVACRYSSPAVLPPLDVHIAGQLYRIAQEAATNAAKHGQAQRIEIRLAKERRGLLLSVRDNGRGLPARKKSAPGLGLDIMRYRAGLIGATLWIDSQPRRGTTVNCLLPRAAPARKKKR